MEMNKRTLNQFRTDFSKAVKKLQKQYGVNVSLGNITYGGNDFRTKMTVANSFTAGKTFPKIEMDHAKYHFLRGLPDLGTRFVVRGITYSVCGYKPQSHKYPMVGEDVRTKKMFKFGIDQVQRNKSGK